MARLHADRVRPLDFMPHALLVDSDDKVLGSIERLVTAEGFEATTAATLEEARSSLADVVPDLVVLDVALPDGDGSALADRLAQQTDAEVVLVTREGTIRAAVDAIHSGAHDYLAKPLDEDHFRRILARVRRTLGLREQLVELREDLRRMGRFGNLVGKSPAIQRVYEHVSRVARTSSTVLLTGETGTGKDLIAETVHSLSHRARAPFVAVNCGAIQPSLFESELFGHAPGSFTGAQKARKGLFEQAEGGTLFLDEITETPADLQVKLLRVLEAREVRPVGANSPVEVDVRVLAATNRRPEDAVREGELREDLFYRLNVFPIEVPPLRERDGDVELLATAFLEELNAESSEDKRFAPGALATLCSHPWPGNVRELRNVVERAFILATKDIRSEHLGELGAGSRGHVPGERVSIPIGSSIAEAERALVLATLEALGGNKKQAAKTLGISLKTLYNRLNAYGGAAGTKSRATR